MPDATGNLAKPTVLVVEDEAPLLTLLRYNLEKQGFRVEEAADGQEALLRVAEAKPDLILLDWMLPVGGESGQKDRADGGSMGGHGALFADSADRVSSRPARPPARGDRRQGCGN
ncbi:response regulator [Leptolyngbya sp. 15MV]|nr:response regulator [Leptolyngbya sp. 15MV]